MFLSPLLLYYIYRNDQISPTGDNIPPLIPTYLIGGCKIDFDKARICVRIFDEFLKGTCGYYSNNDGLVMDKEELRKFLKERKAI